MYSIKVSNRSCFFHRVEASANFGGKWKNKKNNKKKEKKNKERKKE